MPPSSSPAPSILVTDLGGTKSRVARMTAERHVVASRERRTSGSRESYIAGLLDDLQALRDDPAEGVAPPTLVAVGTAGLVDLTGTVLRGSPNMPLGTDFPLAKTIEQAIGLPAFLINDGRASAMGEYRYGVAAGRDPMIALFFGTGVGIGVIVDERPLVGVCNAAGEVGHTLHRAGGRICGCGRRGCFESYCGGRSMTDRATESIGPAPTADGSWTVTELVRVRNAGDERAASILAEAELAAGALVANLCTVFNPAAVVLGGGILSAWPELRDRIEAYVADWCSSTVASAVDIAVSQAGSDAILWGAAELAERGLRGAVQVSESEPTAE